MGDSGEKALIKDLRIEVIDNAQDFKEAFEVSAECFGRQVKDGIWGPFHPGWDTPEGVEKLVARLVNRWATTTEDKYGRPNTIFLKASVTTGENQRKIVGFTTWMQVSLVEGFGDAPSDMPRKVLESLYPDDSAEQKYCQDLDRSLHIHRHELAKAKESQSPPAFMALDLCTVSPTHQGLGIAKKLVQWGLDEAQKRGNLECMTEASLMGRHVYRKLGFESMGEIEYSYDKQFEDRYRPSNLYMRTRPTP